MKHGVQIRNPKSEARKKAEGRRPKVPPAGRVPRVRFVRAPNGYPEGRVPRVPFLVFLISDSLNSSLLKFGLRPSAFFRPSGFGLRPLSLLFVLVSSLLASASDTNSLPDTTSSLRPPRGEIQLLFWEQYGAWVIFLGAVLVAGLAAGVWFLTCPKKPVPVPWCVQAREDLEPLRHRTEDGMVLSRVSQILRRYIASAFGLGPGETTTAEFCRVLIDCERIGAELSGEISDFLKEGDRRKFAPLPAVAPYDAVDRSLKIIQKAEDRLAQLKLEADAAGSKSDSGDSSQPGGAPRLVRGA
jgi:hypothetical protein